MLAVANHVHGQYTPPQPPPFAGFINDALRQSNTNLNALDIGGSERVRLVDQSGYGIPGIPGTPAAKNNDFRANGAEENNDYLLSRTRFHIGYTDSWWGVYGEGQSSLESGDRRYAYADVPPVPGTVKRQGDGPEDDSLNLQEGYLFLGNPKEFPVSLKAGRQELSYGEERLVGTFDWNNIGHTYDAVKLILQTEWVKADFFISRPVVPVDGEFNPSNDNDLFSGIYATTAKIPKQNLDLYFLALNANKYAAADVASPQFPQPSSQDIYTVGGRAVSKPRELGNWDYSVEGAYQFGDFLDTRAGAPKTLLDQSAYMYVLQAGYTFENLWSEPRLGAEFDYGSGNGDAKETDGMHGTFQNLFPTNHKFYGSMDLASLQNLEDAGVNLTLKPCQRVNITLMGNLLWLANTQDSFYTVTGTARGGVAATPGTGFGVNPNYDSFLGSELTAVAGWAVTGYAQLEASYSRFFHGPYLSETWSAPGFGARDAEYYYMQLKLKF